MDTTRRMFVGIGTAAAATAAAGLKPAMAAAATATNKDKFWIAGVTPCDKNYEFDAAAYREQFQWWKSQGADGVLVLGTNGEGPSFSVAERKRIAEFAMKNNNGLDLIITTGTANFKETIELSQHAAAIGASAVLVHPPFYFKNPAGEGVVDYFNLIFDKVKTRVMYYHIPRVTGVPVDVSVIQKLAEHPNFAGVKNSNAIPEEFETFSTQTPNRLNIISGTDNNMLAALRHGNGVILGSGNVYTKQVAAVFAAHRAGQDPTPAYNKLVEATTLMQANGYGSNYNAIKYALNQMMGVNRVSLARPPHVPLTDEQMAKLRNGVQQLKALT
ncbi:MAG TPA: dihydrodipicolinate synthase family protein [Rhizomicrobium sp.]|jgi:4-hydroxy-tetrahydrodipicolinate synthase|nr:dihydrodipicolinate synthase family protein [Rhizomicrobium sp.]